MRRGGWCLLVAVAALGCSHDWDLLDPAFRGAGGEAGSTGGGPASGGGPAVGGQGGTGGLGGAGGGGGVFADPWWDATFARRRQLLLSNPHDEEMIDFPVLVALDATRIDYGVAQPDGTDLRFIDEDGTTELAYEIEAWDPTGTSFVWVRVPAIAASSEDDYVAMYYGNPRAADGQNVPAVWSNGYLAVWHLDSTLGDVVSGFDGTNGGSVATEGLIGPGRAFDGVDDFIDIGAPAGLDGLFAGGGHVSAWVYAEGPGGGNYGRVLDRSVDNGTGFGWSLMYSQFVSPDSFRFTRGHDLETGGWDTPGNQLTLDAWHHVAVNYDDGNVTNAPELFVDGDQKGANPNLAPEGVVEPDAGTPLRIGNGGSTTLRSWDGRIDEVRISSDPRSGPWLDNQVRSMTDAMITFGAEQPAP